VRETTGGRDDLAIALRASIMGNRSLLALRFSALAFTSLTAGCALSTAEEDEDSSSQSEALTVTPVQHVLLLSCGFGSCNPSGVQGVLPTEARSMLDDIESRSGLAPVVVRTCFGGARDADRFEYMVTKNYTNLSAGTTTVTHLEAVLRHYLAASPQTRLDAYGHSHGGWLVGRVVQDLGPGTATSYTLNVILSDAISRTLCTPRVVISGFGRADYCGRFPLDLQPSVIRANTKGYLGVAYQTDDWLHSTPLSGVENIYFNPGFFPRISAQNHRALYTLPLSWGGFQRRFEYR